MLATISDRHFGVDSNSNGVADYYLAEVITEQDYYPFGMQMPGRKYPTYQPAPPTGGGSPSSPIELYRHSFTTPATGSPYTATPNTQSAYIASSQWASGTGSFTGTLVPGSTTDYALTIPTTPIAQVSPGGYTLTLNVQSGYRLTLTSFSFSRMISSLSGHIKWRLYVNGTQVAVYTTTNTTAMTSTGNYTLTSPVTGLTGAVSIQLGLQGASGDTTSFTLDNFVLNGFVQRIPTAANIGQGESNAQRYRYGFNGKEYDNEVYGDGGEQDYGMRIYDPRVGRFFSVDPLMAKYPWFSPYQFAGNMPIWATDIDGLEPNPTNGNISESIAFTNASPAQISNTQFQNIQNSVITSLSNFLNNSGFQYDNGTSSVPVSATISNSTGAGLALTTDNNRKFNAPWNFQFNIHVGNPANSRNNTDGSVDLYIGNDPDNPDLSAANHENGHKLGLDDRYHTLAMYDNRYRVIPGRVGTAPMQLAPGVDDQYNSGTNLMSEENGPNGQLTQVQFSIIYHKQIEFREKALFFTLNTRVDANGKFVTSSQKGNLLGGMSSYVFSNKGGISVKSSDDKGKPILQTATFVTPLGDYFMYQKGTIPYMSPRSNIPAILWSRPANRPIILSLIP